MQVAGAVSQSGASSGSAGTPKTKPLPGFGPATGMQTYTARMLAMNKGTTTPGILDWAESGGELRPDWKIPDFTAKEAEQLKLVNKQGKPMATFDPATETQLSLQAQRQLGAEKQANLEKEGFAVPTDNPQINYAQASAREEMLRQRIADKGSKPGLENKLAKVTARKAKLEKRLS
jgi:hypothetical protein